MLKRNLFFLFSITLFAIASVVLNVFNYNPYQSDNAVFINFFTSLFVALSGILAFIIFFTRIQISKNRTADPFFIPSIRQGILVSSAISIILILKVLDILDWWVGGPTVIAIFLLELFFQTNAPTKKHKKKNAEAAS